MAKSHFVGHVVYFAHCEPLLWCSTFLASYVMSGLWTNQMVLFEKIACFSQSNTCVHFSSLFTYLQSTGMSTWNDCNVCGKHFKRLESHLSQNLAFKSYYMSCGVNAAATVAPNIPNDSSHVNTSHVLQGASCSYLNLRSHSTYETHWIL